MSNKVSVTTTRPVLFEGAVRTEFETTEAHRRELAARGLLPKPAVEEPVKQAAEDESITALLGQNATDISARIGDIHDKDYLSAIAAAEAAGKGRKGVADVIEARLALLQPSE